MKTTTGHNPLWRWWIDHAAAGVDHQAVLNRVSSESGWTPRYLFHIVISAGISILGLLLPSSAVLIGAMLISPLMMPIIGMGFGIATFDLAEIRRAGIALLLGSAIAILLSMAFVAVSPLQTITSEIAIRTRPNLFDLLVALLSAIAGGYALIRGQGGTVVGVAIAIALMPPLAVVGFGIATGNGTVAGGAMLLFLTNLVTMALTAALVARLYGFGGHLSPTQTRLQGLLIVVGLVALAAPMALALKQIAWEAVARRQIREAVLTPFPAEARISQLEIEFDATPLVVRAAVLTPQFARFADRTARTRAGQSLNLPLDLHIDQIRVGGESGAAQAAQIAAAQGTDGASAPGARDRVAQRIALIAGVAPTTVLVDPAQRRVRARMAVLPGASLATYRALAARAEGELEGWQLTLVPPALDLPDVAVTDGAPDADGAAALALAAWAAGARETPVTVNGATAAAEAVVAALRERGVEARVGDGSGATGGAIRLEWAPAEE